MIAEFLTDIKNNLQVFKLLGKPGTTLDAMIAKAKELEAVDERKTYKISKLIDKETDWYKIKNSEFDYKFSVGTILSEFNGEIKNVSNIKVRKNQEPEYTEIWIKQEGFLKVYDGDFSYIKSFGVFGEDYSDNLADFDVDLFYEKVYFVENNTLKVFSWNGNFLWTFGDGINGLPENGRLSDPVSVAYREQNVFVYCQSGLPNGATLPGYLAEFDEDGNFVKYHFVNHRDGNSWNNEASNIDRIQIVKHTYIPDPAQPDVTITNYYLYMNYVGKDYIGQFIWVEDTNSWDFVKNISKTFGLYGILEIDDFIVDDNNEFIYIISRTLNKIAKIEIKTGNLVNTYGTTEFEYYSSNPNTVGGFWEINALALLDNKLIVSDRGNQRIQQIPVAFFNDFEEYEYEPYEFDYIDYISKELDGNILRIKPYEKPDSEIIICGVACNGGENV